MDIEKIVLHFHGDPFDPRANDAAWKRLDDTLTELVERSEYKLRLKVEVRSRWSDMANEIDREPHLPKFVKKGQVTVWDEQGETSVLKSMEGRV
jgi:sugar phosphate isomerase/epimerase